MLTFTASAISALQLDKPVEFICTARDVHKVQANICNYRRKYPGAEIESKSKPYVRELPDGTRQKAEGWYVITVKRTAYGYDADSGEPEKS